MKTKKIKKSGWQDLNLRLSAPKADTLPNCVTPRFVKYLKVTNNNIICVIFYFVNKLKKFFIA
jgi:hypothetical protein